MERSGITRRSKGISKKCIIHTSRLGGRESTILTSGKQNEREAAAMQKCRVAIQRKKSESLLQHLPTFFLELSEDDRQAIAQMDFTMHGAAHDVEAAVNMVPLGEEGLDISHEGGEYEVFENLAKDIASSTG